MSEVQRPEAGGPEIENLMVEDRTFPPPPAFSAQAKEKIEAAGGTAELIQAPPGDARARDSATRDTEQEAAT